VELSPSHGTGFSRQSRNDSANVMAAPSDEGDIAACRWHPVRVEDDTDAVLNAEFRETILKVVDLAAEYLVSSRLG